MADRAAKETGYRDAVQMYYELYPLVPPHEAVRQGVFRRLVVPAAETPKVSLPSVSRESAYDRFWLQREYGTWTIQLLGDEVILSPDGHAHRNIHKKEHASAPPEVISSFDDRGLTDGYGLDVLESRGGLLVATFAIADALEAELVRDRVSNTPVAEI